MDFTLTNIITQLFASIMLAIILICLAISPERRSRLNRTFIIVVILCMGMLLSDVLAWWLDERHGAFFRHITIASNFLVHAFGYLSTCMLIRYITLSISMDNRLVRKLMYITWSVVCLCLGILFANLWGGWIYSIDSDNVYHWGAFYWLPMLVFFLLYTIITIIVISHWKQLGTRSAITYLVYILLPIVSPIGNLLLIDLMIAQPMHAIALLVIFANVHIQHEKLMREQQIKMMLSQIQPHFIFNTIATIKYLCHTDAAAAADALQDFSVYLRENMDSLTQNELVSFERELEHTKIYLKIEKLRFEERLNIIYDLEVTDFYLPFLTVQPLAENAVKHGITKKENGGTITIATRSVPNGVKIIVSDDGAGFVNNGKWKMENGELEDDEGRQRIGIKNVRDRLASMCGGMLTVESEPGKGTKATIIMQNAE